MVETQHPILLYDQLDCAASTDLQDKAGDETFWTVELFVAELDNLIDHLERRDGYDVLGQSWGSMLVADFAGRRPRGPAPLDPRERSREHGVECPRYSGAETPASSGPAGCPGTGREERNWEDPAVKDLLALMSRKHVSRTSAPPPELVPAMRHLSEDTMVCRTMYATKWVAPRGTLGNWTSVPGLSRITAPALGYNGEFDTSQVATTVPFFELISKVRRITFADSGHFCHLEDRG